ncbi:MAG: RNA-binding protein [bacterium]|uniref:RNP-1 like RNA-binding protein n=2 Tax=Bacteria candidate phyla TaxID=1783234 RepID=A0A101I3E7_UNCT6|nr:MAG: RNP-1 like RNA-binding protein [candidate division TA06 bacterium 32_111]KUK88051.1 MAG: RNP-1 like RNA-binding protein [candidate division TA06 bacterium 34_109]MDI6700857.1 RNA-binding protein [bacterium]HAF06983.1 RNA-binding protein [candidate division WOR-3 bacterium]HCP16897.1 RNA-binding protein [candidate division WOR-3 bacterium]
MKIYVGNLSFSLTDEELKKEFEVFGEVNSVTIIKDRETNRSKGFGFVEMSDENAQKAINELNGKEVAGRKLVVNQAKPREEGFRRPRGNSFRRGR